MATSNRALASRGAYLALARAFDRLGGDFTALCREHGLSRPQYNALRILVGAGAAGLTCSAIAERLIHRDPDITRLIDRLEKAGLVTRRRSDEDRRVVLVSVTPKGRKLCDELAEPVLAVHERQFGKLKLAELKELQRLLELALE